MKSLTPVQSASVRALKRSRRGTALGSAFNRELPMDRRPNATTRAIELAIAIWHVAGCRQLLRQREAA